MHTVQVSRLTVTDPNGAPAGSANARQCYQHYIALAEAAEKSGDRVSSESFYQYADHYYRILRSGGAGETNPA